MTILDYREYPEAAFQAKLESLYRRPGYPPEFEEPVREILNQVRCDGDEALIRCARQFDRAELTRETLRVSDVELQAAVAGIDPATRAALEQAKAAITDFARRMRREPWRTEVRPGVVLGEQFSPLHRVGVYIPGGTAPLVSTVLHTAAIAAAAGVPEIVAVTPPGPDGKVNPAILAALKLAGATEVYRLGGVYGIAALAYGTQSVKPVEKIVGPGNAYVTAAKKLVYGTVAIDMVAGPSEILVLADETADPRWVAADLLSQAEHGSGREQAVLVTTDPTLPERVVAELERQKRLLPRLETVERVLQHGVFLIIVADLEQAIAVANGYAPEHLELHLANPEAVTPRLTAAGAIFEGPWTPEPVGDFCAGPSHVLPTAGSARFFSGISLETFLRRSSVVRYTAEALYRELPTVEKFAELEGLTAHGRAGSIRREVES